MKYGWMFRHRQGAWDSNKGEHAKIYTVDLRRELSGFLLWVFALSVIAPLVAIIAFGIYWIACRFTWWQDTLAVLCICWAVLIYFAWATARGRKLIQVINELENARPR